MKYINWLFFVVFLACFQLQAQNEIAIERRPLRVGIVGLTHDHVRGVLGRPKSADIEIVGIAEPNSDLAHSYLKRYGLPESLWFRSMNEMVERTKPEAVCAFNSIYEHREVVEYCAPHKIHVMVEKPLAVNLEHAKAMQKLAKKHGIHLLTNYETTWYPTHRQLYEMVQQQNAIGQIRKVVVRDGHPGPKEIGCSQEFLGWLTDPKMNGGGAIIDFGCYGADLMTWLMHGERPTSVTAVAQTLKHAVYPKVDDDATIIVTYPHAQGIFQASWNWPMSRKDMEVYGTRGYVFADNKSQLRFRPDEKSPEQKITSPAIPSPENDPFSYLAAVVKGKPVSPQDLSSLEVNMVVVEILDAAVRSSREGKTIQLAR